MNIKQLNDFERLIVARLRLELEICDINDEELPSSKCKQLIEAVRSNVRLQSELWFDIIEVLRQKERNKRLRGKVEEEANLKYKNELDKLNRRWTAKISNGPSLPTP